MSKKLYPVVDCLEPEDRQALGISLTESIGPFPSMSQPVRDVHAILTGEFRAPKKGEWYLSGAIPEVYRAPNDLSTSYHIMKLVRTKTETRTTITVFEQK